MLHHLRTDFSDYQNCRLRLETRETDRSFPTISPPNMINFMQMVNKSSVFPLFQEITNQQIHSE